MAHRCELNSKEGSFGAAVTDCYEDEEGSLWVSNGEYDSIVNYCPVCGYKAKA